MTDAHPGLLRAFREDHALLGKGFHRLSQCLRAKDVAAARRAAQALDAEAGAHIAFEEEHFYPRLKGLLGDSEVGAYYREHAEGLEVVGRLCGLAPDEALSEPLRQGLLERSEAMETHIAECGELFEAIGRLPAEDQSALYERLVAWRERKPGWRRYAEENADRGEKGSPPE